MDKYRAPLYERLVEHRAKHPASFHVPGHKNGAAMPIEAGGLEPLMALDFTEITGLDDLHQPEGVIREAEQLAAACYGAERTFFLVQGSTLGNMALILSVCGPGDLILVDRFVHKSVLNGLMLAHAHAVFLTPSWDPVTGYAAGIEEQALKDALNRYPQAKAVFLTRPNYFGQAFDLTQIVKLTHQAGIPLLVDEAHGAHFGFSTKVPKSAIQFGADAVVQSTHKMLSALTMGAMLHIQGSCVLTEQIERSLRMLQTSSPSYPIMASLDVARSLMHARGAELIDSGLAAVTLFVHEMKNMPWFMLPANITAESSPSLAQDPFKQSVRDSSGTLSGYELKERLEDHGCMVEMADTNHVLLVFSPYSTVRDTRRVVEIFRLISTQYQLDKKELTEPLPNIYVSTPIPTSTEPVAFSRHMMNHREVREVPLAQAADEYSADMIIPYPPGIPFVYPGEKLDGKVVEALLMMAGLGARFQGGADASLSKVRVLRRSLETHERMT